MIVKQTRAKKGKAAKLIPHLLEGAENEEIQELHGDVEDIVALSESRVAGTSLKHEMRQIIISPDKELTPEQEQRAIEMALAEMGAEGFEYAAVKHVKMRANGSSVSHIHIVLPERDADGKALDKAHFKVRNEKLSRLMEIEFGHELVKGTHNKAVFEHLRANGKQAEAALIEHLTHGAPALSQFSGKAHQVAKRLGVDLPKIAQNLKPGKGEGVDFHAQQIAQMLRDHPNARVSIDHAKGHLALTGSDGTFIASLNRVAKIDRAQNDAILTRITEMNAQETPAAHLPTISKETEDGRTATTARTDATRAAAGAEPRAAPGAEARENGSDVGNRVDQVGHDGNLAEARPSVEPRPRSALSASRNSGNAGPASGSNDRDEPSLAEPVRGAGSSPRGQQIPRAAPENFPGHGRATSPALTSITALQTAQLQSAWTPKRQQIKEGAERLGKPISQVDPAPIVRNWPKPKATLSKLQAAQLQASWDHRREQLLNGVKKLGKPIPAVDATPMPKVWPKPKLSLSKLDRAVLEAAWSPRRQLLKDGSARLEKLISGVDTASIVKTYPTAAALADRLPMPALRKLFAHTKQLSGMEQKDAIASLLKAHGLHLAEGAKAGVITINRRLSNGSAEFLGSLDRFAGLKTQDADRAATIASIMSKVNVTEAKPANLPSNQQKEAPNVRDRKEDRKQKRRAEALGEGRANSEIWQHYAAGIEAQAGKLKELERIRTSGIREAKFDAGRDQARHERDQIADRVSRETRLGRAEPRRSDDSSRVADVRKVRSDVVDNSRSAVNDHGFSRELKSDAQRDRVSSEASQQAPTLTLLEKVELKSAMTIYGSTIAIHSAPIKPPKPLPKPVLAPRGRAAPRKPSAPAPSPGTGVNHVIGGDFVTADFGDDGDDETKKKRAQEQSKRVAASLRPKM